MLKKDVGEKKQLRHSYKDKGMYNSISIKNSIKDNEISKNN